jgi:hypothetical protein
LKSIGQLVPPSIHAQQRIQSIGQTPNFRYQPSEPGHRVIFALIRVSSVFHPWLNHLQIRFRPRMKHG